MLGGRASRNVLLTLLGAGVVGGGVWNATSGSSCSDQRFVTRQECEAARGAGQCREASPGGPWQAANCPTYRPRSGSSWFSSPGYYGGAGSPPSQTRSGSTGRVDAPASGGSRSGTVGGSSRGGFGSSGSAHGSGS